MKVRATQLGYYNKRRQRPGVVFVLKNPSDYSSNWMEAVDRTEPVDPKAAAANKEVERARAEHVKALEAMKPVEPKVFEPTPEPEKPKRGRPRKVSPNDDLI